MVQPIGEKCTYHNHHAFMEQLFRNEHPKDVVQKCTTQKNCTHLIHKTLKMSIRQVIISYIGIQL